MHFCVVYVLLSLKVGLKCLKASYLFLQKVPLNFYSDHSSLLSKEKQEIINDNSYLFIYFFY